MTFIAVRRNQFYEINGQRYRIEFRSKDGKINAENLRDQRYETFTDDEIADLWDQGKASQIENPTFDNPLLDRDLVAQSERTIEEAKWRQPYMKAYEADRNQRVGKKNLERIIVQTAESIGDNSPPTPRRFRRWLQDWFDLGRPDLSDPRNFAPRYVARGRRTIEFFDPDVIEIFNDVVDEHWLCRVPYSAARLLTRVYELVGKLSREGRDKRFLNDDGSLRVPSLPTAYRMLNEIPKDEVTKGQRGAVEADRLHEPVIGGPKTLFPNARWEIDHTLLDVIVLDETRNVALGRPWLTLALDAETRMPMGFYIGFLPPSAYTVGLCLRMAIKRKKGLLAEHPDIRGEWDAHGKPMLIAIDNGKEFVSKTFDTACFSLGIDVLRCPIRRPRYKGKIERFFGRLARQHLHYIPGTTFSNTKERGDLNSEKMAVMTLSDLKASILKYIVDDYLVDIHRGIGVAPKEKWAEGVAQHPVNLPKDVHMLDVLLSNVEERQLTREGITYQGLKYCSKDREFRALINRPDKPDLVEIRINHGNLNSIQVLDWRTGKYIEVPSIDPEYTTGLTMAEHTALTNKAKARRKKYERITIAHLIQVRAEFRETIIALKKAKKIQSKRLLKVLEEMDTNVPLPVANIAETVVEVSDVVEVEAQVDVTVDEANLFANPDDNFDELSRKLGVFTR